MSVHIKECQVFCLAKHIVAAPVMSEKGKEVCHVCDGRGSYRGLGGRIIRCTRCRGTGRI